MPSSSANARQISGCQPGAGLGRGAALLEVITGGQELGQPVAEQFLFLAQVEVHLEPQCCLGEDVALNLVAAGID